MFNARVKNGSYRIVEGKDLDAYAKNEEVDQKLQGYIKNTGGTVAGDINVKGNLSPTNLRIHEANGTSGVAGYVHFMTIKITGNYVNKPISIEVVRRSDGEPTILNIMFKSGATTNPDLQCFLATGNFNCKNEFYMYKASSGVWYLFGKKTEAYDSITVYRVSNAYNEVGINIEYVNNHYSAVPSGYTQAVLNNLCPQSVAESIATSRIKSSFVTETFDLKTGATAADTNGTLTYNVYKSGYTPVAIVSYQCYGTKSSKINVYNYSISGSQAFVLYRNLNTSALAANDTGIRIVVLYK